MLKCPACQKRVLGQDLVSGVCSHCGQKLAGTGDSSLEFQRRSGDPSSDTIDPFSVSRLGESQPSAGGSEQTFISDVIPGQAQDVLRESVLKLETPARKPTDSEQTFLSDEAPEDSAAESVFPTDSAQTFVSDDFGDNPSATMPVKSGSSAELDDPNRTVASASFPAKDDQGDSGLTVVSDEFTAVTPVDQGMKTYVDDSLSDGASADHSADMTFVSDDVPELMLKTIQSVWGDEGEQEGARPHMTMKAKEPRQAKTVKQTLVIKTKTLADTKDLDDEHPSDHQHEYELLKVLGEVALPFDLFAAVGVERRATGIGHDQGRGDRGDADIPARAVEAAEDEEFLAVAGFGVEWDIPG